MYRDTRTHHFIKEPMHKALLSYVGYHLTRFWNSDVLTMICMVALVTGFYIVFGAAL